MKTIIVTGASRGIGAATVRTLRADGIRVIGIARSADLLHKLSLEKVGSGPFEYIVGDICDIAILEKAIKLSMADSHSLEGIVLNAAVLKPLVRIKDMDLASVRDHFEVNVFAQLQIIKLCLPFLRKNRGRILFVSSGIVNHPGAGYSPYTASKAAMNYVIECLAKEEPEITCIAIRPGIVETDLAETFMGKDGEAVATPEIIEWFRNLKKTSDYLKPEVPGSAIARIVQRVPNELSGKFLVFDDPKLKDI